MIDALKPDENKIYDRGKVDVVPNRYLTSLVAASMMAYQVSDAMTTNDDDDDDDQPRSELDSHANMVVVGKNALIVNDTGQKATVSPFTPDLKALQHVPIVDALVQYDCPYANKSYLLMLYNALSVPTMECNLIPPFIIREAGVEINETPKTHAKNPTIEDHSVCFKEDDFRIPLSLHGMFSYFPTSKPTQKVLDECDDVYRLTPETRFDPHTDVYARNESNMLDWEGNIVEKKDRQQILLSDIKPDSIGEISSYEISSIELKVVDERLDENNGEDDGPSPLYERVPKQCDEVGAVLGEINPVLDQDRMCSLISARGELGRFQASIGSTNVLEEKFMQDDTTVTTEEGDSSDDSISSGDSDSDDTDSDEEMADFFETLNHNMDMGYSFDLND